MRPLRLAIVSTHPIQYYSPVFRELAQSAQLCLRVFYTFSQAAEGAMFDAGFGATVQWDVPLLSGYDFKFVANTARRPGLDHFRGLQTPTLTAEIAAWKADAVLIYTWNSWAHLCAMRYFKGRVPVLFRGDSTLLDRRPYWRTQLRRLALTWIYRNVDVAIAVGSNNRDYFAWCGLPAERIALAPHSVDTVRFALDSPAYAERTAAWRAELGIAGDAVVILFAGKLQPKKNPLLLLEAFAALAGETQAGAAPTGAAHLIFAGNGELEGQLRRRARGVPNVHFLPFQNQSAMPALYRLGDLFVLPSQGPEETWGLALNEAMASGRAVIASNMVGGARDLIQENHNGWMFDSGDLDGLTMTLRRLIARGREALHAAGRVAQQRSERFSSAESARGICAAVLAAATADGGAGHARNTAPNA